MVPKSDGSRCVALQEYKIEGNLKNAIRKWERFHLNFRIDFKKVPIAPILTAVIGILK